ncbi:hypothetical protein BT96DRAFT_919485 [Gymnopus androsaceus JB14]|uniref:DUF221-domain-containing protein n=1 Tax=Gymnopus androsaceus JB14 TaxID=1447944 RepID=A0A6A4HU56_9AGAR|nr:hypothetical protein BT96DRAFT_919485 [Gymnopus androsaceus JB14]
MGDIQDRPFSKNYSGLENQTVIGVVIVVLAVTGQELMKRKRRGKKTYRDGTLGSRESWEFGYLYQGRSWARYPSPPIPLQWPLQWIPQALSVSEEQLNQLRGIDAALYIRWLRGCFWFVLLQTCTTFPILFPIHVVFSNDSISPESMTRASISSLVDTAKGLSLLWIHICLLFWITLSWMATLFWISNGAFRMRAANIAAAIKRKASNESEQPKYYPHPHPQYGFADVPSLDIDAPVEGLRFRTVMVSNVPPQLRNENELKEYFEYYMSRKLQRPAIGLNSTTQPGMFNKMFSFLFNRVKKIPAHMQTQDDKDQSLPSEVPVNPEDKPIIERVVIARKMTELASLLQRREEVLRLLETAHIKLAKTTLDAVKRAMDRKAAHKPFSRSNSRAGLIAKQQRPQADVEVADPTHDNTLSEEQRMEQLIKVLGPYVDEFGLRDTSYLNRKLTGREGKYSFKKLRTEGSQDSDSESNEAPISPVPTSPQYPPSAISHRPRPHQKTVWDTLLGLPRSTLDAYQPLVSLSYLFRGKTVPSIDYYTAKLNLLTSLITENRAKPANRYDPVSTAFVTFADPDDARRACKFLTVHPNNPLACLVTMAPQYQDLDWHRVMKTSFNAEFVKDWVVGVGVWVGLVSIQNISTFWPGLKNYLDGHPWEEEVIQSFVPTLLVSLLALLIPLILLLIGKKAHTITTLSALHDLLMTRYYKFLIVNILVFFCVGTAALQSVLISIGASSASTVLNIVATSFPSAGPFYVGWLIFTVAMHGGFEIVLFGLPLIMYPTTKRQVTPRRRAVGIRPRTFNYYYWLPTHLLVINMLLAFSVLNPLVIPFGLLYFFIESGVVKNQLIHVYAKNYEGNGQRILIRAIRYSLDGLTVFLAYMVVLKKFVNVGLAAFLIAFTVAAKIFITRLVRAQFEIDDIREAKVICGGTRSSEPERSADSERRTEVASHAQAQEELLSLNPAPSRSRISIRLPQWVSSSYATIRHHPHDIAHRSPIPFTEERPTLSRLMSLPSTAVGSPEESLPFPPLAVPLSTHENFGPVTPHPPPISWDDQSTLDLPYDNPYYTRAINNVLWLPRDPCGTLDLDDTVDLRVAISVDPAAVLLAKQSRLPIFTMLPSILPDYPLVQPQLMLLAPCLLMVRRRLIFRRSWRKELSTKTKVEHVARPRRPSTLQRHTDKSSSASLRRRPSSSRHISTMARSVSDNRSKPQKQNSIMSVFDNHSIMNRSASVDPDAELVMAHPNPSQYLRTSRRNRAIYHEVLAEEKQALAQRLEEEQAEVDKSQSKSWFTRWMFTKAE